MHTVDRAARARAARALALYLSVFGTGLLVSGCRVQEDDIHRWESTAHGPDKLQAVLLHDKYDGALRVEAALSLVRMKPRQGRRVGIGLMVDTLAVIAPEPRAMIVASLVPAIIAELKKPPPIGQAGQPSPPDASFPYKDAAYAMLMFDRTVIVADEPLKQSLRAALVDWAMADFEHRLDNRTQAYGMEQLLRHIGPTAVVGIPKLMTREARRLDQMSALVAELGEEKTKEAAALALVEIAKYVSSNEWVTAKKPELQAANAASKLAPTEAQFQSQLTQYQDEELFRVLGAMKKVGTRPAVDFCLTFAAQKDQPEKRRQGALAAIEGRLDRNNPDDIKRVLEIAGSDAPDAVLDLALRRVSEMPREVVVDKLYDLFKSDKWKIRRAAAGTVIRMSKVKHIDEFMAKLPPVPAKGFAMAEALTYGASLGELTDGKPLEALQKHMVTGSPAVRTSALAYYFTYGTSADLSAVQPYREETTEVPVCETDPDCKWVCEVAKEGTKDQRENKDIKTIGDYVRYCIEPAMRERQPASTKKEEKK